MAGHAGEWRLTVSKASGAVMVATLLWLPAGRALSLQGANQQTDETQQKKDAPEKKQAAPVADSDAVTEVDDDSGDAPVTKAAPDRAATKEKKLSTAWEMLNSSFSSPKSRLRIQSLSAIGTLGDFPKARTWMKQAADDQDRYVRVATVGAISSSADKRFMPELQTLVDDPAVEVSFAAAVALWKMGDHSGEKLLYGVLDGERKTSQGMLDTQLHTANEDLHSPSTLALLGAEQGAYALLGPFGIGVDAAKMMHKSASGNSARVLAATLLGQDRSHETMERLIDALYDRDYFVRAAAARDLGAFHDATASDALLEAFGDSKETVRLMAAASYIRASSPEAKSEEPKSKSPKHGRTHAARGPKTVATLAQ